MHGAKITCGAGFDIDVTRVLTKLGYKITGRALETDQFGVGDDLYVHVTSGINQLWGKDAHGAVVGWEGFIKLGHDPAYGGLGVYEIDLDSAVGQIERGLDTGDASAYD